MPLTNGGYIALASQAAAGVPLRYKETVPPYSLTQTSLPLYSYFPFCPRDSLVVVHQAPDDVDLAVVQLRQLVLRVGGQVHQPSAVAVVRLEVVQVVVGRARDEPVVKACTG